MTRRPLTCGDRCPCCPKLREHTLAIVNGALVCFECDRVSDWPAAQDGLLPPSVEGGQ